MPRAQVTRVLAVVLALAGALWFVAQFQARILLNQAASAAGRGQWSDARSFAEKAVRRDPSLGLAWYYLGAARSGSGAKEEAIKALAIASERTNKPATALLGMGEVLAGMGQSAEAREALSHALRHNPKPQMAPAR